MISLFPYKPTHRNYFNGLTKEDYLNLSKPAAVNYTFSPDGKTAVIDIDGYIGRDLLHEWITGEKSENTVKVIKSALREISSEKIIVNINSPGGSLNDGLVIMNMLQSKNAEIITNIMGFTSGAGAVVSQSGNIRRMPHTSFQLLHRAKLPVCGHVNQNTLRALFQDCRTMDKQIVKMFVGKSSMGGSDVENLMDAAGGYGKWINAQDALKFGLIDEVYDPADEQDENTDHLEPDEKQNRMRNVQRLNLANMQSKKERMKDLERLKKTSKSVQNESDNRRSGTVKDSSPLTAAKLSEISIHEAGHAIIATCFGGDIECIEVAIESVRSGRCKLEDHCVLKTWQSMATAIAGPMAAHGWWNGDSSILDFSINQIPIRDGEANDDGFRIQLITESLPINQREATRQKALHYCRSRLLRNWHHVKALANELKECRTMDSKAFKNWFNKATKYNEFNY